MRITILALGSRGDVQPYAALGRGLQDAGRRVRVVTFENFEPLVREQGLDFHPVRGSSQALLGGAEGATITEAGNNPIRLMLALRKTFGAIVQDYLDAFSADVLRETDAIINQLPASLFGYDLAEKLRVPYLNAAVIPLEATGDWPLPLFPQFSLGGWYNRLTYRVAAQMAWQPFRSATNRFRAMLGLAKAPFWGHFRQIRSRRIPVLNGFSEHVVPRPHDWGAHVHLTGWWLLKEPDWTPPEDLIAFLDGGPPPVFIGFGSMPVRDPQQLTHLLLKALAHSGQRAVLSTGWAGLAHSDLPETVYKLDYAPYEWLFPRMLAIVHHGGSGTTGLALRSGVPSLIVPFVVDQFYWGRRIVQLGVGPPSIPYKKLTADDLAAAIKAVAADPAMRRRAAALGEKLRAEDGVATAVRIIHQILGA